MVCQAIKLLLYCSCTAFVLHGELHYILHLVLQFILLWSFLVPTLPAPPVTRRSRDLFPAEGGVARSARYPLIWPATRANPDARESHPEAREQTASISSWQKLSGQQRKSAPRMSRSDLQKEPKTKPKKSTPHAAHLRCRKWRISFASACHLTANIMF